jgi:hypothetical protein
VIYATAVLSTLAHGTGAVPEVGRDRP